MDRTEITLLTAKKILSAGMLLSAAVFAFAQEKADINGRIVDPKNNPVPYASVTFSSKIDKLHSDAVLTDENGYYSLKLVPGNYAITVEAIDHKKHTLNKVIKAGPQEAITLLPEESATMAPTKNIEGVTITAASTKPYRVELDKKVYDPSTDVLSKGGNLQDVLSNVPSVDVDTDGTVSMRGNTNVRFLINGKPSSLLGIDDNANALQSIPADQIDRIEVITNPSSKYEASGTAGILNIILKKTKTKGFNGSVEGALGYLPTTRLNTNLSWRKGNWTWYVNGGGGYNERKNNRWNNTRYFDNNGTSSFLNQSSDNNNKGKYYNANSGFTVDLSEKAALNLSGMIRYNENESRDLVTYQTLNADRSLNATSQRLSLGGGSGNAIQGDLGFDYKFNSSGHNLFTSFSIQQNNNDGYSNILETQENHFVSRNIVNQSTVNNTLIGKVDYELPLDEKSKLEAGYRFDRNENDYDYNVSRSFDDVTFVLRPNFTSQTVYTEMFNAFYAQFKSKTNRLGYQLGLRTEISDINVAFNNLSGNSENIKKHYTGLFPSVFLSYDIAEGSNNQLLLNYSRRINRPRSWFLIPFNSFSINDDRNQFLGNPDLDPSYINSFELGYAIQKKKFTINPTLYYQHTTNTTQMVVVRESAASQILVTRPFNVGSETNIGLDLNSTADLLPWWKIMANVNLYHYTSQGEYYDPNIMSKPFSFAGKGFSSRLRMTNTFKVDKTFNLQLQGFFRGAEKTASRHRKEMYAVNFGANKTIWKGDGTISFSIQDIFNSRAMRNISYSDNFEREQYMQFMPRQILLSLTYRFKQGEKIEQKKRQRNNSNEDSGEDMPIM